jgi:hypothetical protein
MDHPMWPTLGDRHVERRDDQARPHSFQDFPLFTKRRILATETLQFTAFIGGQSVRAPAGITIRLPYPISDALCRRLELSGERPRAASSSDELDHPLAILRRVRSV